MASNDIRLSLTGSLHPHLLVEADPLSNDCILNLELYVPDALFPDPDELADLWGAADSREKSYNTTAASSKPLSWSVSPRAIDIERPLKPSAEPVRLSLSVKGSEADIPLHARYLSPSSTGGHDVDVFGEGVGSVRRSWTCGGRQAASRLDVVPISLKLHLPAAKPAYQVPVDITTAVVVWLGWAWIVYKIAQVVRRNQGKVKTQ